MNKQRKIPQWLKNNIEKENDSTKKSENEGSILKNEEIQVNQNPPEINRSQRILRSNSQKDPTLKDKLIDTKPVEYPFVEYEGNIIYLIEMYDIASACEEIMTWVLQQYKSIVPIAFDMEWPFSFQTGPGKSSVIQVCADLNTCYLFHLSKLKKLPAALINLLSHEKVCLHGINIKNDFRKLQRDFPEVNVQPMIDHCVDLGTWCNDVCNTGGRWSLERLTYYICKLSIDKNKKVRMSKWHVIPLDENQQMYAAIDVYISQVIYYELEKRENLKEKQINDFKEKYGETSLTAMKSLGVDFAEPIV